MTRQGRQSEGKHRGEDLQIGALGDLLDRLAEDGAMTIEEEDGFFAALHCSPELVLPSEFLPLVLGQNREDGGVVFESAEDAELFTKLALHHWNEVGRALSQDEVFLPLLWTDEDGKEYGNDWAIGFLRGTSLRKPAWAEFLEKEEGMGCFIAIFALAYENDPDPGLRPYKEPVTEDQRLNLLAALSAGVTEIYKHFAPLRKRMAEAMTEDSTIRREGPKLGRNDPCFCGSGKKYKKCCGAVKAN